MEFNSIDFLLFFVTVGGLFFVMQPRYRWMLLLVASYFFYMYWRWEFIFLIVISTGVDYYCGMSMSRKATVKERRPWLWLSLVSNLGLLFTFKYLDFFIGTVNDVAGTDWTLMQWVLPMGISFYTFQTLSYTIDVYYGKIKCEPHLGKFALYVSFFPQLVAGPIERASNLLPQLQANAGRLEYNRFVSGLTQIVVGFFKKVVVADTIAIYVDSIYGPYELYTGFTFWVATYLFAIQIYCDFSGYSDIAIGAARMLGYDFMENFRQPYFSKSVTEFWRRWHISLSSWLRDYLYIPLGGNRKGKFNTYRNLMLTMLLGGLWHGPSWNFVIWGALNGLYLSLERVVKFPKFITARPRVLRFVSSIVVFHLICLTWVFFQADTIEQSLGIFERMFTLDYFANIQIKDTGVFASIALNVGVLYLLEVFVLNKLDYQKLAQGASSEPQRSPDPSTPLRGRPDLDVDGSSPRSLSGVEGSRGAGWSKGIFFKLLALKAILILLILVYGISEGSQFIYFQF